MTVTTVAKEEELLTLQEVADWLRLDPRSITRYVEAGKMPGFKVPGSRVWRFKKADVERLLGPGR